MYSTSMTASHEAERSLSEDFFDLAIICTGGSDRTKIYYKSFAINRTRYPGWNWSERFRMWPGDNPDFVFPDTIYDFRGYKNLWWNLMNKDGRDEHQNKIWLYLD